MLQCKGVSLQIWWKIETVNNPPMPPPKPPLGGLGWGHGWVVNCLNFPKDKLAALTPTHAPTQAPLKGAWVGAWVGVKAANLS